MADRWASSDDYEPYVGRWSRALAPTFLAWVGRPLRGARVLDVGCGTGALTEAVSREGASTSGIDPSDGFIEHARRRLPDADLRVGDAQALPFDPASFDLVVSGLALNFVPDPTKAAREIRRVLKPGGVAAAYVWDYAGKMELMRHFWDAAIEQDPVRAGPLDEGRRFPLCQPDKLRALFASAGLVRVETSHVDQPTVFRDFDDYWRPFLGGQAPAPGYCMSLTDEQRADLRERIRKRLPMRPDGSIHLVARAWTVKGVAS